MCFRKKSLEKCVLGLDFINCKLIKLIIDKVDKIDFSAYCLFLPAVDTLSWFFPKNVDVFLNKYTRPE